MVFSPPHSSYDPTDKLGFSYETVMKRWPIILTGVADALHNVCHVLALEMIGIDDNDKQKGTLQEKIAEGRAIIEKVSKLKYMMARDHQLEYIPDDGEPSIQLYNSELKELEANKRNSWFSAPWLFAECYLYRLLRSYFVQTTYWKSHDPFYEQKIGTFKQSGHSIFQIAKMMHELTHDKESLEDNDNLKIVFDEMIQMCLWGNATDLSLLTHISQSDIQNLQSVGKDAQISREKFILRDDRKTLWEHILTLKDGRVDFVLDNSGFELFTDLVFADFLITFTPYVSTVIFHPKLIPWFVSDVTPLDFKGTFESLRDPSFFSAVSSPNEANGRYLEELITRWSSLLDNGSFKLSIPLETSLGGNLESRRADFWTTARPYWEMKSEAFETFAELEKSGLVIFKGDLNYRKLTGDIRWPAWTSFSEAIGPLAGSFPLLSLRTNKADVVVGVNKTVAENLDSSGKKWRVDGRYALISFCLNHRGN